MLRHMLGLVPCYVHCRPGAPMPHEFKRVLSCLQMRKGCPRGCRSVTGVESKRSDGRWMHLQGLSSSVGSWYSTHNTVLLSRMDADIVADGLKGILGMLERCRWVDAVRLITCGQTDRLLRVLCNAKRRLGTIHELPRERSDTLPSICV